MIPKVRATTLALSAATALVTAALAPSTRARAGTMLLRRVVRTATRAAIIGRLRAREDASQGRFTPTEIDDLVDATWRHYEAEAPGLRYQPTLGSRLNSRLACVTVGLFQALLARGTEHGYAVELVADATWKVYERWGLLSLALARWRQPTYAAFARRVRPDGTVALRFPFEAPGYVARHRPDEPGFGFDMTRCAVADYFRSRGATDLCVAAWCNLDYALAEMGGMQLRRTTTLVEGADRCDFRWSVVGQPRRLMARTAAR